MIPLSVCVCVCVCVLWIVMLDMNISRWVCIKKDCHSCSVNMLFDIKNPLHNYRWNNLLSFSGLYLAIFGHVLGARESTTVVFSTLRLQPVQWLTGSLSYAPAWSCQRGLHSSFTVSEEWFLRVEECILLPLWAKEKRNRVSAYNMCFTDYTIVLQCGTLLAPCRQ